MKLVQFTDATTEGVAFVNPSLVMTVEARSATSVNSILYFGGSNRITVVGKPADVAKALTEGMQ